MKKNEKIKLKKLYRKMIIIVFIIILIDQLSKILIMNYGEVNLFQGLTLKVSENTSNDNTSKVMNIFTNFIILGIVLGILRSDNQFINNKTKIILSFAFAGGVSNLIDRICRGRVIEWIQFEKFPAFNIADTCILIGWILFVAIFASFSSKELTKVKSNKKEETKENIVNEETKENKTNEGTRKNTTNE